MLERSGVLAGSSCTTSTARSDTRRSALPRAACAEVASATDTASHQLTAGYPYPSELSAVPETAQARELRDRRVADGSVSSASSCADPMCSISRDPRWEER